MVLSTTSSCFPVASSITLASTNKRFPSGNHSFFGCFRRRSVLTMTLATPSFNYTDKNAQHGYGWRSTDNRIGHRIGPIFSNIDKTSDRQNMTIVIDVIFQNVVITRAFRGIQKVNTYWHVEKSPNLERWVASAEWRANRTGHRPDVVKKYRLSDWLAKPISVDL